MCNERRDTDLKSKIFTDIRHFTLSPLLCIVMTFAIVLSSAVSVAAYTDLRTPAAADAAEFLSKIGVLQTYDADSLTDTVSRADFALYAARVIKADEFAYTDERFFTDLPMESYALGAVNTLVKQGAVSAGSDRLFRPDDAVTYDEALKIMLSLMGYDKYAAYKGGYPVGYIAAAAKIGITAPRTADGLTLGSAAALIYDCITKNMYEIEEIYSDGASYTTEIDNTLLSTYYSMYRAEGVVTSADGGTVNGSASDDYAVIDGTKYNTDSYGGTMAFLGQRVTFVYRQAKDETPQLYYIESSDEKRLLDVDIDNFEDFDGTYVRYYTSDTSDKTDRQSIAGMNIIYNGRPVYSGLSEIFSRLSEGSLRFADTDYDGKYNNLIITDYVNFSVKSMTDGKRLLYNDLTGGYIDLNEYGTVTVKNADGDIIDRTDLTLGSVLSVAASTDKAVITIIMCETTAEGAAEQISDDGRFTVLTLGGKDYRISGGITDIDTDNISLGSKYILYFNSFGHAVSAKRSDETMRNGYLCDIANIGSALDSDVRVKIFTSDGDLSIFDLADTVKLDGKSYKKSEHDTMVSQIPECSAGGGTYTVTPQIILYATNDDGNITKIDSHNTDGGDLVRTTNGSETLMKYNTRFGKKVIFSSDTKIYCVPQDADIGSADETDFNIRKPSAFYRSLAYPIEAYKTKADSEYEDILVYRSNDSLTEGHDWDNSSMMMVDSVLSAVNSRGNDTKTISGIIQGNSATYTLCETVNAASYDAKLLHCGDLIRCRFNARGEIIHIELLYCAANKERVNWKADGSDGIYYASSFGANFNLSYGYVYERGKNVISWGVVKGSEPIEAYDVTYIPIMVYDDVRRSHKVYKGTIDDIAAYIDCADRCDAVILQTMEGTASAIAVYKY